jgi:alpha-aminoadipate carrier protein LysW
MAKAICPGCRRSVYIDQHIQMGEYVNCPECGADLEVISLHPIMLDWADEGLDNGRLTWGSVASAKWPKWDKRERKKVRVKRPDDSDWLG